MKKLEVFWDSNKIFIARINGIVNLDDVKIWKIKIIDELPN
jgi:hypothetical protein